VKAGFRPAVVAGRALLALFVAQIIGCASGGWRAEGAGRSVRVSEVLGQGDAARRASLRLVIGGLEADALDDGARAESEYARALQVDPTNPYAYLALARHWVVGPDPDRALPFLDQAEALFRAQGEDSPHVLVHIDGLRGESYYGSGRTGHGLDLLERARRVAPATWDDGHLSARELR